MIDKRIIGLIALLACAAAIDAAAQPFVPRIAPFTVERSDGSSYLNPFSGGLLQPRIGLRDADGDGDADLFTLNPDNILRLYRNEGNFRFRRIFPSPYEATTVRSWFRLADIDGDGDDDLFTSGMVSEVIYYRNLGSAATPAFATIADTARRGDTIIYTQQETVPSLVDIDADGDLDLFNGNPDGSITFYRNIGTPSAPRFTFITSNYQGILVISTGTRRKDDDDDATPAANRHGASVLDFADIDRDGDLDMLFGDFFTTKLLLFHNDGTPQQAAFSMARLDTAFRPSGDEVVTTGFNQPVSADIDRDGDLDILVSSLYPLAPDQPVILFENVAEPDAKAPIMRRRSMEVTDEIDLGTFTAPAAIRDSERDGLLVGSSDGSITYYEIRTTDGATRWRAAGRFATLPGLFQAVPTAGDLDGDGRAEIIIGDANDGRIRMFRFQGNRLDPIEWPLDTFRVNQYAAPSLADIDGDGDLDLFVGAGNGRFVFFRNTGSPQAYRFEPGEAPAPFNTLDIGSNSAITFRDIDGDGDPDAIVGGRQRADAILGSLRFYLNDGGTFLPSPSFPDIITDRNPVPALLSLTEGRFLISGSQAGGMLAYHDTLSQSSGVEPVKNAGNAGILIIKNFLRRGERSLEIAWNIPEPSSSLLLVDPLGRTVARLPLPETAGRRIFSLPDLPPGIYFLSTGKESAGSIIVAPW